MTTTQTYRRVMRTPNELRRNDHIVIGGERACINEVLCLSPGVVQVLALTQDGRIIEPVLDGLVTCVVPVVDVYVC